MPWHAAATMTEPDAVVRVQQTLLDYWRERPQAADTVAGIQRWWLRGMVSHELLAAALAALQQQGLVDAQPAADGRVRWRRVTAPRR